MGAPLRRTHTGGQPSKGPRRLITAQVGNQMGAEIMANAADLNLSVTEYATMLLAKETGRSMPWWVQERLTADGQLEIEGQPRRRRSTKAVRRLVIVQVSEDGSPAKERSIGFRVPDDIADDVIVRADELGLTIGNCTTLLLAKQMGRPAPVWVQKKLQAKQRDEAQLAMGA